MAASSNDLTGMSLLQRFPRYARGVRHNSDALVKQLAQKTRRLDKLATYWKSLGEDYKCALKDVVEDAKKRPVKASMLMSCVAGLCYAVKTNPSEYSFVNQVTDASNELLLLSATTRNTKSELHVRRLEWCLNKKLVRTINLVVATVVWEADYGSECDMFAAHCTYLQPRYSCFHNRVLDVGLMGCWLILTSKMKDFDVNGDSFI